MEAVQPRQRESAWREAMRITGPWTVAIAEAEHYPSFTPWQTIDTLSDLAAPGALPTFSGTFRYETRFEWASAEMHGAVVLDLGQVYETAGVWLNGERCGLRLCPPYRFAVGTPLRQGRNSLVIEVTNTLGTSQRNYFSRFAAQDPSGLLGPVRLLTAEGPVAG